MNEMKDAEHRKEQHDAREQKRAENKITSDLNRWIETGISHD
jgi:hypothetical protein